MSEAFQEIGPTALSRWRVYTMARELQRLAGRAAELSTKGPQCDVPLAQAQLDRMRAILGEDRESEQ